MGLRFHTFPFFSCGASGIHDSFDNFSNHNSTFHCGLAWALDVSNFQAFLWTWFVMKNVQCDILCDAHRTNQFEIFRLRVFGDVSNCSSSKAKKEQLGALRAIAIWAKRATKSNQKEKQLPHQREQPSPTKRNIHHAHWSWQDEKGSTVNTCWENTCQENDSQKNDNGKENNNGTEINDSKENNASKGNCAQ